MTAINHALTGALIGLAVKNPALALPVAFLSHFLLDMIPHYDPRGDTDEARINSREFLYVQLLGGAFLCFLLVMFLAIKQPEHWLTAAFAAFFAASPDLLSLPRYISVKRTGKDIKDSNWFWHFHSRIQWKTGQIYAVVELVWFTSGCWALSHYI